MLITIWYNKYNKCKFNNVLNAKNNFHLCCIAASLVCASGVFICRGVLSSLWSCWSCWSSVNILDMRGSFCPFRDLRSVYSCLMMLSLLYCYLTSLLPLWGLLRLNWLQNDKWKKKLGVSEITVESGFSLVVLNAIQDLQWCSCNRVVDRCSFLLSVLLAPSGVGICKYVNLIVMKVFLAPGPFLQTWSKHFVCLKSFSLTFNFTNFHFLDTFNLPRTGTTSFRGRSVACWASILVLFPLGRSVRLVFPVSPVKAWNQCILIEFHFGVGNLYD